jgi:hypothetical protein
MGSKPSHASVFGGLEELHRASQWEAVRSRGKRRQVKEMNVLP